MWNLLGMIQRHLALAIPVALVAGLGFGLLVDPSFLATGILPLTFLMVFPMMVSLKVSELAHLGDLRLQGATQAVNFLAIPALGWILGLWLFPDRPLVATGLLLTSLLPTSGMTITWTGLAKGNVPAAVRMTLLGLLLGSLLAPLYLKTLMGTAIEISIAKVFSQIALTVLLPLVAGLATRALLVRKIGIESFQKSVQPRLAPFSTLGVLGIVFVAMALKAKGIAAHPEQLVSLFAALGLLYGANFALSAYVGRTFFARSDAIALLYGTVMRNLSIALAIAMSAFGASGPDIALLISLAYIVQVQMAAWSVKLVPRLFPAPQG